MSEQYSPPKAEITLASDADIDSFERFSAWGVFGLSIITLGIYFMYWFFTRTNVLNSFHPNKISSGLINSTLVTYVIYMGISFLPESYYEDSIFLIVAGLISLAYLILYMVWLFSFRARLLDIAREHGQGSFRINPALTFFFQCIYLQFKINQYIDNKSH